MADSSVHRTVTVERITPGVFTVTNTRGGQIMFGTGSGSEFTPTELLLAALPGRGLLEQTAEHDPGLLLGLHGLPEPQPAAGQGISAGMHLDAERPTRQLL